MCSSDLVPMRAISQAPTASHGTGGPVTEANPPLHVYDTSGPYTDPDTRIDIRHGLAGLRDAWITERGDTEYLDGPTSAYGRSRLEDPKLAELRFNLTRAPRRAMAGRRERPAQCATLAETNTYVAKASAVRPLPLYRRDVGAGTRGFPRPRRGSDRKSTRLNSSH